jgi:hypothetical protein
MKTSRCGAVLGLCFLVTSLFAGPRDAQWKKVDEAVRAGLPKTAIEALEPIITAALADESHGEALKAITRKIALQGTIQGSRAEEKIVRLETELTKVPNELKPLLEAVLAHWYWDYFQQNRWRFGQRTQTATAPGTDLRSWDLARILAEIDRHFTAALADEAKLRAIPVHHYDEFLPRASVPDSYRPTMFDFVAYQALLFYQAGEQGTTHTENEFEIDAATSPIFADATAFLAWQPQVADETAPLFTAVRLLQKLMLTHRASADRSAFFDADLARLRLGHNKAVNDDGAERYKAALQRFVEATANHESSARALAALATLVNDQDEPANAHAIARRGLAAFPDSAGGALCANLIQKIEHQEASIATERIWNAPWPTLDVTYRNVTRVHFRAVKTTFEDQLARARWELGRVDRDEQIALLAARPTLAWSADLPPTPDYKSRTERLTTPTSLEPGFYIILASHDPNFSATAGPLTMADVWVSTLALVTESRTGRGGAGGFVLDARTGEPIENARVRTWRRDREGYFKEDEETRSDRNGRFELSPDDNGVIVLAEHRGQSVASHQTVHFGHANSREDAGTQTTFFTDRMLYRPGQTIQYKGISLRYDRETGKYSTLARRQVTVVFSDPNGKEIARTRHDTNDFGSFSGVFTAPRDRLMGQMNLRALEHFGVTHFNVEEYKRPKFRVEIAAPIDAPKLDTPVDLSGSALAYTGAAIGGAKVMWRVERSVRLPLWCWWWQPPASKAVAHGSSITDPDGTFKLRFTAVPDRTVPATNEPVFVFTVHVDITDTNGETRSEQRTVPVGYTALQASVAVPEWQTPGKPVEFTIETKTLEGLPHAASGTLILHALQQPATVRRAPLSRAPYGMPVSPAVAKSDVSNPETWELSALIAQQTFMHDAAGTSRVAMELKAGIYRASLETQDRFGKKVTARQTVRVVNPSERQLPIKEPNLFLAKKWSLEPGETFTALWGTGYAEGRAFVEVECGGKMLQSYWTEPRRTQHTIEQSVTAEMRGGFTVRVRYVRENRAYVSERVVEVPWSNKQLAIKWESFRSKLLPGQKETWTAVLTGPDAKRAASEMVAGLYDASLDLYKPHRWPQRFSVFRREHAWRMTTLHNAQHGFRPLAGYWPHPRPRNVNWFYRGFPFDIVTPSQNWNHSVSAGDEGVIQLSMFMVQSEGERSYGAMAAPGLTDAAQDAPAAPAAAATVAGSGVAQTNQPVLDLSKVTARKNLNETAFFFPHLLADRSGQVKMVFTMPEALTEWRFFGFAHDKQLAAGFIQDKAVTAKDLMVEPNPPRFVREGDALEFTVKVSNQSDASQSGKVRLTFADAATLDSVDAALGNRQLEQEFSVPAKQSRGYSWRIAVPDGMGFLTYKAVGTTANLSDGEEGFLPVLSRRILVTESLPLPIRGRSTREFDFAKLSASGSSPTLRHQALTVQMVSQPAWHAVLALPYLMEYPYECSEQIFNRFYANALARHIAGSDPKIRRIFDLWKNTPALDSPLEKNADLKSVLLEETPWLRHAKHESEARRNIGVLFDANRLDAEAARSQQILAERQLGEGLWPWFPGGPPSEYISLYIATGFGRLRQLGVSTHVAAAIKALPGLDAWMHAHYQRIETRDSYVPSALDALYLYGRSFFLTDRPIAKQHDEAVQFFIKQSRKFWVQIGDRQSQAHVAIALQRFGDKTTARDILKSLKERSVTDAELGMFWRDHELSWWWYRAPIETQALMIEAFAEVAGDVQAVEDCKVWLLKQKQVQDWKTTKATADAVYALLLRGANLLASDARVEVALGGQSIKPERTGAGTGYYEKKFAATEIKPTMGKITVTKPDDGVSWGSVHWQYLEEVGKITAHAGTPLTLKKSLWIKETSAQGQRVRPVTGAVAVGDELVVRIELRADRDMEYLHLKDQRGSGTEPVNVISRYKRQDGLAYYESTRDTASHFFIDYLPKGTYVFEYSTRVQLKGQYQSGLAEIQCMYAPEFNSHSESIAIDVR